MQIVSQAKFLKETDDERHTWRGLPSEASEIVMSFRFVSETGKVRFSNDAQKEDDGNSIDSDQSDLRVRHFDPMIYNGVKSREQQMLDQRTTYLLQLLGHASGSDHKPHMVGVRHLIPIGARARIRRHQMYSIVNGGT
jgi:hypothetical protein